MSRPATPQCLPTGEDADLVQEVHAFVQDRTFFQAINGIHGLLLPQPPGYPALVAPGEPPIQSFH